MAGPVNHTVKHTELWRQAAKWPGSILIHWVSVKDIPNHQFIHIENPLNENKPACQGRDCQEIFPKTGERMLTIFKSFISGSKLFENFIFYDEQERFRKIKTGYQKKYSEDVEQKKVEKSFYDDFGEPPQGRLPFGHQRPNFRRDGPPAETVGYDLDFEKDEGESLKKPRADSSPVLQADPQRHGGH